MNPSDIIANALIQQAARLSQARDRADQAESRARNKYPFSVQFLNDEGREKIVDLYYEAIRLEHDTGVPHEVDHIVPLSRGGEHLPDNLQVVTASYNRSKGANLF